MENSQRCPECGSDRIEAGYGMAGGGMGLYMYCGQCSYIIDKVQDSTSAQISSTACGTMTRKERG